MRLRDGSVRVESPAAAATITVFFDGCVTRVACVSLVSCIGEGYIEVVATWVFSVMVVGAELEGLVRCECFGSIAKSAPPISRETDK
jgi:hypothetical protein